MTTTFGRHRPALRNPPFPYKEIDECHLDTQTIDGKRHYLVEGIPYPSVTTVLSSLSKDGIDAWVKKVGEEKAEKIKNAAAGRGTKLHQMCEDYLHNKPTFADGMMPNIVALFKQVQPWLDEHVDFIYGNEIALYSHSLRTAGRCDLIAQIDGKPAILDFKTSTNEKKEEWIENYFLQVTAYSIMFEEMYNLPIEDIHVFICTENSTSQHFKKVPGDYITRTKQVFADFRNINT
jgi:genome maintenance exonuclease 1